MVLLYIVRQGSEVMQRLSLDDIPPGHPVVHFHKIWQAGRNGAGLFERRNYTPVGAPALLPWMVVIEPVQIGPDSDSGDGIAAPLMSRYRYRLCGTGYTSLVGRDLTGLPLGTGKAKSAGRSSTEGEIEAVLSDHQPRFSELSMPVDGREFITVIRGVFPVSLSGDRIDQFYGLIAMRDFAL